MQKAIDGPFSMNPLRHINVEFAPIYLIPVSAVICPFARSGEEQYAKAKM